MSTARRTLAEIHRDLRRTEESLRERIRGMEQDLDSQRVAVLAGLEQSQEPIRGRIEELRNTLMLLRIGIDDLERRTT